MTYERLIFELKELYRQNGLEDVTENQIVLAGLEAQRHILTKTFNREQAKS